MRITAEVEMAGVDAMLTRLRAAAADMTKPMRLIARTLEQHIRQTFRDETGPWGSPWPPHSPVTLKARERRGNASIQKLIDTAAMYDSLRSDATSHEATVEIGAGLPDPRASVHQFGAPEKNIPARPFFPLRSDDAADIPQAWWADILAPLDAMLVEATR